jgi:hypothetical protein
MLATPPPLGPDGQPLPSGSEGVTLVMSVIDEMRSEMKTLADTLNAPKQIVRDPQTGEITAVVPMRMN